MFCMRLHEELKRRRMRNLFQRNAFLICKRQKKRVGSTNSGVLGSSQRLPGLSAAISNRLPARDQEARKGGHEEPVGTHGLPSLVLLAESV